MKTRLVATILIGMLLAGCSVAPNYRRPALTPPDVFRGADPAVAADPASLADLKWFELFKDEELQALIRTALEANHDLRDAAARVEAASAVHGITRSEQFP